MSKTLFITGTGTDVGKTFVSGLILKKLRQAGLSAGYYKAAMSGNPRRPDGTLIPGDALYVKEISGLEQPLEEMCPYVYENALSPIWPPGWRADRWSWSRSARAWPLSAGAATMSQWRAPAASSVPSASTGRSFG